MLNSAYKKTQDSFEELTNFPIAWNYFTLQDAVDFAKYAVKITIDTMKFQQRIKTVGGDIDILVLKPNKSFWISRKKMENSLFL